MSLIADVSVNHVAEVGTVYIHRLSGGTNPDSMNTYEYEVYNRARGDRDASLVAEGQIVHRYGDGGLRLLLKALLDAERHL